MQIKSAAMAKFSKNNLFFSFFSWFFLFRCCIIFSLPHSLNIIFRKEGTAMEAP
jgi:hypothetical protein